MSRTIRSGLAAFALTIAMVGCDNPVELATPVLPEPVEVFDAGIHPLLYVTQESDGSQTLEMQLRRQDVPSMIGSFQGEFVYDAEALTLSDAHFPDGIMGAWFEAEPGVVRIAGARLDGMTNGPVIYFSFDSSQDLQNATFRLRLEELRAADGFIDLRSSLVVPSRLPVKNRSAL